MSAQLVVIELNDQLYGVDARSIHEIIKQIRITRVPNSKPYVEGIANLRGKIIPVIDTRKLLALTDSKDSDKSSIIFVNLKVNDQHKTLGFRFDRVWQVINYNPEELEKIPNYGSDVNTESIVGILEDSRFPKPVIVIELEKVINYFDQRSILQENAQQ